MKSSLKNLLAVSALLGTCLSTNAAVNIGLDPNASWQGFMNVSEIPQNGGAYVFGSGWGTADLRATFAGSVLTLSGNTIGDPNPFWYTPRAARERLATRSWTPICMS